MGHVKAVLLGLAMVTFGLIAFLMSVVTLILSPVAPNLRYQSNQFFLKPFSKFARALIGIKLVILNKDRTDKLRPVVMVGNHQTGLDFAIISQACPGGIVVVAKRELKNIPIFGWFFMIAGNLLIDRSNPKAAKKQMDDARTLLVEKRLNLAVFPEGTRSRTQEFLPFKKGAFNVAISMGLPIIPIVCSSLKGKAVWETADLKGGHVVVSVLDAIETKGIKPEDVDVFRDRIRNLMIVEFTRITALAKSYDEKLSVPAKSCCS